MVLEGVITVIKVDVGMRDDDWDAAGLALLALLPEKIEVTGADAVELVMVGLESEAADDTLFEVSGFEEDAALEMPMEDCELVEAALLLEETIPGELVVVEEAGAVESRVVDNTMLGLLIAEEEDVAAIDVLPDSEPMGVDDSLLEEVILEEEVETLRLLESNIVGVALLGEKVAEEEDSGLGILLEDELQVDDAVLLDGMDSDMVVVAGVTYVVGFEVTEDWLLEVTISEEEVEALEVLTDESEGLDDVVLDITVFEEKIATELADETVVTELVDETASVVVIDTPIEEVIPEDVAVLKVMLLDTSIAESLAYTVKRFAPPQSSPVAPEQSISQSASGAAFPDSAVPQ
jgi:hypothetical protein